MTEIERTPQEMAAAVAEQIRKEPHRHMQMTWRTLDEYGPSNITLIDGVQTVEATCQTAACVAGWASALAGDRLIIKNHSMCMTSTGLSSYRRRGQELLGLDSDDAGWLFAGDNSRATVLYALDELARGQTISRRQIFTEAETESILKPRPQRPETSKVRVVRESPVTATVTEKVEEHA